VPNPALAQIEPDAQPGRPSEEAMARVLAPLDEDEDTSMVTSLPLHLMSEHQIHDALQMDPRDALALHHRLHLESPQNHPVHDLRFRPSMAKSNMLLNSQRHAAVQRLLVPVQALPLTD
jgi:hypothetical protein